MAEVNTDKSAAVDKAEAERVERARRAAADLEGPDERLRASTLDEREEFEAEYAVQARAQQELPEDQQGWVTYQAQAGVDYREISVADWKKAGVDVEQQQPWYVRWDARNDWRVPLSMFEFLTDQQFQLFVVNDNRFKVTGQR